MTGIRTLTLTLAALAAVALGGCAAAAGDPTGVRPGAAAGDATGVPSGVAAGDAATVVPSGVAAGDAAGVPPVVAAGDAAAVPPGVELPAGPAVARPGVAEPDPRLTPGAVFAAATVAEVCRPGYAGRHRDVPVALKRQIVRAYGAAYVPGRFEIDHLVPLEIGGANVGRDPRTGRAAATANLCSRGAARRSRIGSRTASTTRSAPGGSGSGRPSWRSPVTGTAGLAGRGQAVSARSARPPPGRPAPGPHGAA